MKTRQFIEVEDATLDAIGCEALFEQYRTEIAQTLIEQEGGDRADGDCVVTVKITIGMREEGVRYHATIGLKKPGFVAKAAIGRILNVGDGGPRLRINRVNVKQMTIPGTDDDRVPFADEDGPDGPVN